MTTPDDTAGELIAPMLATLGDLPEGGAWAYEFKWDGVRAIAGAGPAGLRLLSRNDRDITAAYPELAVLTAQTGARRLVLDGEVVAMDDADRPSFSRLQQRMHVRAPAAALRTAVPVRYQVFDLLVLDGVPITQEPYERRRELLAGLDLAGPEIRVPPHFVDTGSSAVVAAAQAYGLEGVMAKRLAAAYQPGRRSRDWIKAPFTPTQEVVIVGWKAGEGRRAGTIGSLVMAVDTGGATLSFAGAVGTGFTGATLADLHERLRRIERRTPAVSDVPRMHARGVTWVEPVLVGEVAYRNWTPDGRLRHPSWRGLRPDKSPAQATASRPAPPRREVIEGMMQTPDGRWRVEIVKRGDSRWYRIVHGDDVLDWLSIAAVERILDTAGVDRATLGPPVPEPAPARRHAATG